MPEPKLVRALHIPAAVLALKITWSARLVLSEVLDLYQVNGNVFAHDNHFIERCRIEKRTVGKALAELEDAGLLDRDTNQSARHKRILTPLIGADGTPRPMAKSAIGLSQNLQESVVKSATDLLQNLQEPIADSADINTNYSFKSNTIQTPTQKKKSECSSKIDSLRLPAEKITAPNPVAVLPSPAVIPPFFEEFWQAFGKKEDKYKCQQQWDSLKPDDQRAAIAAVPAYVLATPEKRFRKNPLTWLNGRCWLDEEIPAPVGSPQGYAFGSAPPPLRASSSPTKQKDRWI